ncbi:MAG: co-chaperone GroES [Patescibacteria group bacterium]|nr:co-chaperone GroES [Patescibacteria group bacterium]MDD4304052.1 co-chaperone GroES [Patescibacteria group bacterium]MDD4694929.1 co-chaperone GroES [Patescibacteria group bacterium]
MKLKPIFDNIVVKKIEETETTKSGIIMPDTIDKEKPQKGEVVAVGSGKISLEGKTIPMELKIGDRVLFRKYSPDEIKIDGEEYLVMTQSDVIAILE